MNSRAAALSVGGLALAAGTFLALRQRRAHLGEVPPGLVRNPRDVSRYVEPELADVVRRTRKAGARGRLEYIGAGMTGVVLRDERNRCYKTGRSLHPVYQEALSEEASWLRDANRTRGVREHVVKMRRFHPGLSVIERECVDGTPGHWGIGTPLRDLHDRIGRTMLPRGWTAPEFKEDSYVTRERDNVPILVDGGSAIRVGPKLVEYVEGVLNKTRRLRYGVRLTDLAFYVRRERGDTIPEAQADRLLARLPK